ncbi:hypothetical protein HDU81_002636, partial [Chytriomyces hyalinus]
MSLDFEIKPLEAYTTTSLSSPQEQRASLLGFLDLPMCPGGGGGGGLESPSSRANPPLQAPPLKTSQQARLSDPSQHSHASPPSAPPKHHRSHRKIMMAAPVPIPDPTNPKPPLPKGKFFQNGILIKPPPPASQTAVSSSQRAPLPPPAPSHLLNGVKAVDNTCLYRSLDPPLPP